MDGSQPAPSDAMVGNPSPPHVCGVARPDRPNTAKWMLSSSHRLRLNSAPASPCDLDASQPCSARPCAASSAAGLAAIDVQQNSVQGAPSMQVPLGTDFPCDHSASHPCSVYTRPSRPSQFGIGNQSKQQARARNQSQQLMQTRNLSQQLMRSPSGEPGSKMHRSSADCNERRAAAAPPAASMDIHSACADLASPGAY